MNEDRGKKVGDYQKPRLTVLSGGKAGEPRTHVELELDRALRALFYAMRDREGRNVNKNVRNVSRGATRPWRMLVKRLHDAQRARYHRHNYPIAKEVIRELDRFVDILFLGRHLEVSAQLRDVEAALAQHRSIHTTGDYPAPSGRAA